MASPASVSRRCLTAPGAAAGDPVTATLGANIVMRLHVMNLRVMRFRAPLACVVCMHRHLGRWDAMSVGMFLQTLLLALTERGLGSCVEVSIVGYPESVRAELDSPEELSILSGLAVGYADPDFAANKLKIAREPVGENAIFLDS